MVKLLFKYVDSIQDSFWVHSVLFIIAADDLTLGSTRGVKVVTLSFSLDDLTLAPDVFSSCSFIPHAILIQVN